MIQELITFVIVAIAVIIAVLKVYKRFRKKKAKAMDFQKVSMAESHNCTECAAECVLRDLPKHIIDKSAEVCDTNYTEKENDS